VPKRVTKADAGDASDKGGAGGTGDAGDAGDAGAGSGGGALVLGASKKGVQRRVGRPSDWTAEKADRFVEVLADSCNVSLAARSVGRSVGNVYIQRSKDSAFRAAWDQALSIGYARLELMMLERALHGVEKAVRLSSGQERTGNDRTKPAISRRFNIASAAFRQHL